MFEELKKNYLASFDDKIYNIEQALENANFQVLSTLIHQLVGSSGSYGLIELSEHCSLIEQQLQTSSDTELSQTISQLLDLMRVAKRQIN